MNLFGCWMHRKFREKAAEPFKDGHHATAAADHENKVFARTIEGGSKVQYDVYVQPYLCRTDLLKGDEKSSDVFSNWHQGLLTIGTLGFDPIIPWTVYEEDEDDYKEPCKETSLDVINNGLITYELTEHKIVDKQQNVTKNEKSSESDADHKCDVKLYDNAGEEEEEEEEEEDQLSDVNVLGKVMVKKSQRISLEELLSINEVPHEMNTVILSEHSKTNTKMEEGGKVRKKKGYKHLLGKIRKAKRGSTKDASADDQTAVPHNKLIKKLLRMFHTKVHPAEYCSAAKKKGKVSSKEMKTETPNYRDSNNNLIHKMNPRIAKDEKTDPYENHIMIKPFTVSGGSFSGNREYWIKTDTEYLVLEL